VAINIFILAVNTFFNKEKKNHFINVTIYIFTFTLLHLPWVLFSRSIPKTHENYMGKLHFDIILSNLERLKLIVPEFCHHIIKLDSWGLIWPCLIASLIYLPVNIFVKKYIKNKDLMNNEPAPVKDLSSKNKNKEISTVEILNLWALFILHIALYAFVFIITPWDIRILFQLALTRIFVHLVPLGVVICGYGLYYNSKSKVLQ